MKKIFQTVNFLKDDYNRPQDKWSCGRAKEGCPCLLGPDRKGKCRGTEACLPIRKGDRWHCSRSEVTGGKCAEGPLPDGSCCQRIEPCSPERALRSYRGLLSFTSAIFVFAVLLLALNGEKGDLRINPGPLSLAHATLEPDCSLCHSEAHQGTLSFSVRLADEQAVRAQNRALCLNCHDLGAHPLGAHGVVSQLLSGGEEQAKRSEDGAAVSFLLHLLANNELRQKGETEELACAVCHREHHGREHSLTQLSNQQCQVCHQDPFVSFAQGHPSFSDYPYLRRTRIGFDHNTHLNNYFRQGDNAGKAPGACMDCHTLDDKGDYMQVRSFEQACASCHQSQIKGEGRAGDKGLIFLKLPGLDTDSLQEKGLAVGEWPQYAEGDISAFMSLLLEERYISAEKLKHILKLDMLDLRNASAEELATAQEYAWAIKQFLFDLRVKGHVFLSEVLSGGEGSSQMLNKQIAQLPFDTIVSLQEKWLPGLLEEVSAYRSGVMPALPIVGKESLTISSELGGLGSEPAGDDDLLGDDGGSLLGEEEESEDEGLLFEEEAGGLLGDFEEGEVALLSDVGEDVEKRSIVVPVPLSAEEWSSAGGWYRDDSTYQLYYRPVGHADAFLRFWLDSIHSLEKEGNLGKEQLLSQLAGRQAVGLCTKCHSVDEKDNGQLGVNWKGSLLGAERLFTSFSHTPHFSALSDTGCVQCHQLNPESQYAQFFGEKRNPKTFQSNFKPLEKSNCMECHQPEVAGSDCLQCHQYHTGDFSGSLARKLSVLKGEMNAGE